MLPPSVRAIGYFRCSQNPRAEWPLQDKQTEGSTGCHMSVLLRHFRCPGKAIKKTEEYCTSFLVQIAELRSTTLGAF